jgi:hypothetical protein
MKITVPAHTLDNIRPAAESGQVKKNPASRAIPGQNMGMSDFSDIPKLLIQAPTLH